MSACRDVPAALLSGVFGAAAAQLRGSLSDAGSVVNSLIDEYGEACLLSGAVEACLRQLEVLTASTEHDKAAIVELWLNLARQQDSANGISRFVEAVQQAVLQETTPSTSCRGTSTGDSSTRWLCLAGISFLAGLLQWRADLSGQKPEVLAQQTCLILVATTNQ
jgi:hypothetical protein